MRSLVGAGVLGLVPHPSTAVVEPIDYRPSPSLWTEQEVDRPTMRYRRDAGERVATRSELECLRKLFEIAGH